MGYYDVKATRTNPLNEVERRELLDKEWQRDVMPCHDCEIKDICKYANTIRRADYNPEVFEVKVTCNIQHKYREVNK